MLKGNASHAAGGGPSAEDYEDADLAAAIAASLAEEAGERPPARGRGTQRGCRAVRAHDRSPTYGECG